MSSIGAEDYSWGTRLDAWKIVLQIVSISPVLGLGFANYYWYTPLFPIRGWFVRFNSHNQFVDLIAQTGVIGLLCFSWIFLEAGLLGLWLRNRVPDGFPVAYVYGALGGLVGTFVAGWLVDWVLPFTYNIGMSGFRASVIAWIFMGGLAAVEQIIRRNTQTTPNLI
jgi:O-antigen ligase